MFFSGLLGAVAAQGQTALAKALLWLNPTTPSIGTTDPIETWTDVGLLPQNDATQAVVANRPALIADIANGYAGARFDGVNDTLNAPLVLPLPWTMAPAGRFTKPASKKYILGKAGTGGIYIAPVTGFVGVDLGGVGIEGTTDYAAGTITVGDDFSSGSLDPRRWIEDAAWVGSGSSQVIAEELEVIADSPASSGYRVGCDVSSIGSDDFKATVDVDISQWAVDLGNSFGAAYFWAIIGGNNYIVQLRRSPASFGNNQSYGAELNGPEVEVATSADSANLELERVGLVVTARYDGIDITTGACSGSITALYLASRAIGGVRTQICLFDNLEVEKSNGDPYLIPTDEGPMISVQATAEECSIVARDNYSGTETNSGVVDDENWIKRGYEDSGPGNGEVGITGEQMRITAYDGVGNFGQAVDIVPRSGDFYVSTKYTIVHFSPLGQGTSWLGLGVVVGGTDYVIDRNRTVADNYEVGPDPEAIEATTDTTATLFVRRTGTTVELGFGATVVRSFAGEAGTATQILLRAIASGATDADVVGDFDDLTAVDNYSGTGNDLQAAPTSYATLYVNGFPEASGPTGTGTLPSIDVIEAGLAADIPEVQVRNEALSPEEITQIALELSIYQ